LNLPKKSGDRGSGTRPLSHIAESLTDARRQGFIAIKTLAEQGRGVAGIIGARVPVELFAAAAVIPVWLGREDQEPGEEGQAPEICPPFRSLLALADACPYLYFSGLVAGDDSCPAPLYGALRALKPVHIIHLRRPPDGSGGAAEIRALGEEIGRRFRCAVSRAALRRAIREGNRERILIDELRGLSRAKPPPLTGLCRSRILFGLRFRFSHQERVRELEEAIGRIKEDHAEGKGLVPEGARRIILRSCPLGWTETVVRLTEEAGAVVVYEDRGGPRGLVSESGDPFQALAGYYLGTGPGAPAAQFSAEGIIDLGFPFCPGGGPGALGAAPAAPDLPRLSLSPAFPGGPARLKELIAAFVQGL
jgi:benzoyl-CoA reductase/2-hydroxyglutaryl-CoA dehydratase subunit BcrC/BadD/HgdB